MNSSAIAMTMSMASLLHMPPCDIQDEEASFRLLALTFYLDNLHLTSSGSCTQFNSLRDFLAEFETHTSSCPRSTQFHHSKVTISDLESFIDFFQQLEYNCFSSVDNPAEVSNLAGPSCFAKESLFGYFIRNIILQWETLDFNQICDIFTEYQHFCRTSASSSFSDSIPQNIPDESHFPSNLMMVLRAGDIQHAMELSHAHHDLSEPSPKNLQQAILTQALIHLHGSHYASAKIALEEVIKIAHSRNDHESIAKAIELLFHVSRNSGSLDKSRHTFASAEELLMTCSEKNVQLKLPGAAAKSSLYLLASRSCNHRPSSNAEDKLSLDWTTLHVALLGDSKLLLSLIRRQNEKESLQIAYAVSDVAMAKADRPLTAAESEDLCKDFHLTCMTFWQSRGQRALALQSGLRFLYRLSMGVPTDIDGVLEALLCIARLRARLTCPLFHPERHICRIASADELLRAASELTRQANVYMIHVLRFSEIYIRGISQLSEKDEASCRITALALTDPLLHAQLASDEMYFEAHTLSALLHRRSSSEAEVLREHDGIAVEARAAGLPAVQEEILRIRSNLAQGIF